MKVTHLFSHLVLFTVLLSPEIAYSGSQPQQSQTRTAAANQGAMTVNVYEKGTGLAVRRAEIRIGETRWYTDAKGVAQINFKGPFKGAMTISRKGYARMIMPLKNVKSMSVYLEPAFDDDATVIITGTQRDSSSKKSISADEATRLGDDPAKVIRLMPGVQQGSGRNTARGPGGPQGNGGGGPRPSMPGRFAGGPPAGGPPAGGPPAGGPPSGSLPNGAPPMGGAPIGAAPGGFGGGGGLSGFSGASAMQMANNSGIIIRGSAPSDSKYYVDDIEVPYVFHNIDDLAVVPGSLLQQVDFEAGGFGVEYGDAMGGVVKLITKSDIPERSTTEFTFNFPFYSGVYDRRPIGDDAVISTSLRRSYIDYFAKQYYDSIEKGSNSNVGTQTPFFVDGHVSYEKKLANGTRKITVITSEDGTEMVFPSLATNTSDVSQTNKSQTKFTTLAMEQSASINRSWMYRTTPQLSYTNVSTDSSFATTSLDQYRLRAPTEFTRILSPGSNFYVGFDPQDTSVQQVQNQTDPFAGSSTTQKDKTDYQGLAGWTAVDQKFGALKTTPGVRSFYNSQIKKTAYDPRLSTKYSINASNDIKAAVGQYSESPTFIQALKDTGRPDLEFERTNQYILGVETRWNPAWTTEVQGFYKRGYRLIESDPQKIYNNNGESIASGIELFIRRNLTSRTFGWVTYTYSRTVERASEDDNYTRSPYDQTNVGNVVAGYRLTPTLDLSGRYSYATGNTYTPAAGSTYDATNDRFSELATDPNSKRNLPASQSISVYLTKDVLFDTWRLSVRAGVESYWFGPQVTGMTTNYDYTTDIPQQGTNTVPFFELKGVL